MTLTLLTVKCCAFIAGAFDFRRSRRQVSLIMTPYLSFFILSSSLVTQTFAYGNGQLPAASVCGNMRPGPPHGENQVSQKDDLDPPFLLTAAKQDAGFVLGKLYLFV